MKWRSIIKWGPCCIQPKALPFVVTPPLWLLWSPLLSGCLQNSLSALSYNYTLTGRRYFIFAPRPDWQAMGENYRRNFLPFPMSITLHPKLHPNSGWWLEMATCPFLHTLVKSLDSFVVQKCRINPKGILWCRTVKMYTVSIPLCLLLFSPFLLHRIRENRMHVLSERDSYSRCLVFGKRKLCLPMGEQIHLPVQCRVGWCWHIAW